MSSAHSRTRRMLVAKPAIKWPLAIAIVSPLVVALLLAMSPPPALASSAAPYWTLSSVPTPTRFPPASETSCEVSETVIQECDIYEVTATNSGALASSGEVVLTDTPPSGVTVQAVWLYEIDSSTSWDKASGEHHITVFGGRNVKLEECEVTAPPLRCEYGGQVRPGNALLMKVVVTVNTPEPASDVLRNEATVSGGGAPAVSAMSENEVNAPVSFGPSSFSFEKRGLGGTAEAQAGGHPYALTTTIDLNTGPATDVVEAADQPTSVEPPRDVVVDLPLGFAGSTLATPKCTEAELDSESHCPADTIVGHITTEPNEKTSVNAPIYNMVPEAGHAAEFGYTAREIKASLANYAQVVPTPQGYVLQFVASDIPEISIHSIVVTFYGNPVLRDAEEAQRALEEELSLPVALETHNGEMPFFTNSTSCSSGPQVATMWMDSWTHPARFVPGSNGLEPENLNEPAWVKATSTSPAATGCSQLSFTPQLSAQPTSTAADSSSGLDFDLSVPQPEQQGVDGSPALRDATVVLPAGMTVNPAAANGLQACSEAQIGWLGASGEHGEALPNHGYTNFTPAAPECPEASKIGTVALTTPLIEGELEGAVYLASQDQNPYGALLAAYIVIDDARTGTIVKIPGKLETDPETGQITGVFEENPQLPFSDLKMHFFSPNLATPQSCGTFTTTSDLEPWSAPESGPDAAPSSSFSIGSNCTLGFGPAFSAGTTSNEAGAFSPFTLTIARQDGEQHLTGLTVTTPPGLLGDLKHVVQCGEPQAADGTCGPESLIGEATVSAGVGSSPYVVKEGRVYLTGSYNNGPFGLSVVIPAVAGPFDLGDVVVRSSIRVNPTTSQITVVSDPLPLMIDSVEGLKSGIPSDVRTINVTINRPSFMLNPTSCNPLAVTGTLTGAQGATTTVSSRFQAANCASLQFTPKFEASTNGKASKANGASLIVKVSSSPGQANIAKTDLTLPAALPSRNSTLQKACLAAVFDANPASCDEGSVIGTATVHTPILKSPLTGPAYLVSYGGAAFPDVEFVLQGEGVTLDLDGKTDIKKGITYSKFETLPDAPIETFETVLPTGPHSILTANVPEKDYYSLCGRSLTMPTSITGQTGAVVEQSTKIAITGCKAKAPTRAQLLAKAIKACKKDSRKSKRQACERSARRKYRQIAQKTSKKR